jgi:hypothetical protein
MNATEARRFDRYSPTNAALAETALACGCKAYESIFTYRRWQALGYQVQRGAKAVRLPVLHTRTTTDEETGQEHTRRVFGTAVVFCQHQVKAKDAKAPGWAIVGLLRASKPEAARPEPEPALRPPEPPPAPKASRYDDLLATWREI